MYCLKMMLVNTSDFALYEVKNSGKNGKKHLAAVDIGTLWV